MASTETRLRYRIKCALEEDGYVAHTLQGTATSGPGRTDLVVCAGGLFFGLEVKTDEGSPSDDQVRNIHRIRGRRAQGCALIVRSIAEARRAIQLRLGGVMPYDGDGLQILDLSDLVVEAVPAPLPDPIDPQVIPFPEVPVHIVAVIDDETDAVLDEVLAAAADPEAEPPAAGRRARQPRATSTRTRKQKDEVTVESPPAPTPEPPALAPSPSQSEPNEWVQLDPGVVPPPIPMPTLASNGPTSIEEVHDYLRMIWEHVCKIEELLSQELELIEKATAGR